MTEKLEKSQRIIKENNLAFWKIFGPELDTSPGRRN